MNKNENIINVIDKQSRTVKTKSLDISFNELLDMYNNKELIIAPDYQRMFRWSEEKQSMFIESLILEMPLPPIFVIELEEGIYELIDGLQRISTYLHFRYNDIDEDVKKDFSKTINKGLILDGCDIVKELNGFNYDELPRSIQLKLKRNFIRMEVLRKETDKNIRYHMFKRLNTGGELLSNQEVRNCTIRLLGDEFNNFVIECSKYDYFKKTISNLGEENIATKKNEELVLRYFALKNNLTNYKKDLDFFLTDYMEKVTLGTFEFNYEQEEKVFKGVFEKIYNMYQNHAFSSLVKSNPEKYKTDIIMYLYDSITCGLANVYEELCAKDLEKLKVKLDELKLSDEFLKTRTGGRRNTDERIKLVEKEVIKSPNA
ncbi:DUF262 domain-containing protein [Anaerofustis stercorihominis]|uniref:DUF262 domain-containing protein n=1 Tax=Anaerofustis stercorihominis TaxID=214853 RepID=A0A3E3DW36_9FIRM|nr:DUF262 domain-containing protein [Anaerofustis stercorihominis]RGD72898.1 DUF262 domain-containing protein [Anaerofustis stercorihominis]